jgi:hypothetical protein
MVIFAHVLKIVIGYPHGYSVLKHVNWKNRSGGPRRGNQTAEKLQESKVKSRAGRLRNRSQSILLAAVQKFLGVPSCEQLQIT